MSCPECNINIPSARKKKKCGQEIPPPSPQELNSRPLMIKRLSYNFSKQSYFVTLHASLQTVVIISSGGEFVLICLGRYGPRCVFRVFFSRGLLGFIIVCYIVRQQSQSVLCDSVLTTMASKTENITVKTTNTLF